MSMIKIEHLRKEYPNVTPLKDVCAEINKGDVISVIGPSGTGKSILLRCIMTQGSPCRSNTSDYIILSAIMNYQMEKGGVFH